MPSTKEYIIKTVYDSTGLKAFSDDVEKAKAAGKALGLSLSNSAKVVDSSVTTSFNKANETVKDVTTTFEDFGRRTSVSFRSVAGDVKSTAISMSKDISNFSATAGQKVLTLNQPLDGLAAKLTTLSSLNRTFSQTFGASFKAGTEVVDNAPEKLSQRQVTFQGQQSLVPVQQLSTVVKTADGDFQKLNQTILTMPNGVKSITRSMTDVSVSYKKAAQAALELSAASKEVTLSVAKVALTTEQAEKGARFFTSGLTKSATLMDISSKSFNKGGSEYLRTTAVFNDQGKKITTVFDSMGSATSKVSQSMKGLKEESEKAGINLGQLISRAAVTIPTWFILRSAIMGVFTGIRDGVTNLVSFDAALQKIKRNLSGTPEEITQNFGIMKKEITDFSLETGKSVEEISTAVKNFATIGFNFKDSLSAGLDATRLSILLFGDAGDAANAFASAMKLLVKEGKGVPPVSQQIAEAFALTAELAKNNKDDLGELTQGLNKFSATAASANLSAKETITLLLTLATAGRSGAMSGTLLSTTFNNLLTNMDKVSKAFGIEFNPAVDSGFSTLMKVLDASEKLSKMPGGEIQVVEKLKDVLGGERGTKIVSSLLAVNDILKENLKVTGDVAKFHNDVNVVLDSESGQAQILGNAFREMGKNFVISTVGAKDFLGALKEINSFVKNTQPIVSNFGNLLHNSFNVSSIFGGPIGLMANLWKTAVEGMDKEAQKSFEKISDGFKGLLSKVELDQLIVDIKTNKIQLPKGINKEVITSALSKALSKEQIAAKVDGNVTLTPKVSSEPVAIISLENELAELKARLKAKGATDIELSLLDVSFLQSKALQDSDKIRDSQSKIRIATIEKERSIQDLLLNSVQESAKAEGASNLEAITKRIELEKSLGIERTGMDLLNQQLELQKAITEETKKTREERLKELSTLIKKTPSVFSNTIGKDMGLDTQESKLRMQASMRGISDEQINKILNPEAQITKGSSLLRDLQSGLAAPMTKSMGSLEVAISSLTQTILQQETRPLDVGVPRMPTVVIKDSSSDITKLNSKTNNAIKKVIEDF